MNIRTLALVVVAVAMVGSFSCAPRQSRNSGIVEVWQSDTLVTAGVVVGDGSEVLSILNYDRSSPSDLRVALPGYEKYKADIQAIDPRTSATLLRIEGARLPVSALGDALAIKQGQAVVLQRPTPAKDRQAETKEIPAEVVSLPSGPLLRFRVSVSPDVVPDSWTGDVVCDVNGNIVGIVGDVFSLIPLPGLPRGWVPSVLSVNGALQLLSPDIREQPWFNGPIAYCVAKPNSATAYDETPSNYNEVAVAVRGLLDGLGDPLVGDDLRSGYITFPFAPDEGTTLVAVYAFPVDLLGAGGSVVAQAKCIGIDWGRRGKPNRLFYGSSPFTMDGGFEVKGDTGALETALQ